MVINQGQKTSKFADPSLVLAAPEEINERPDPLVLHRNAVRMFPHRVEDHAVGVLLEQSTSRRE